MQIFFLTKRIFQLDSPILQDHAASAAASILEGTSSNDQNMLGQLDSQTDDIFGTATVPVTTQAPALVLPTQPSPVVAAASTAASRTASTTKTVAATVSPSLASPQQSSFILSPQPVMTMATGTILTSSTPVIQVSLEVA